MATLQVYQAQALKHLHEGGPDQGAMQELRATTDFTLRATKVMARSLGQVMSTVVVQERHLWLTLAQMADADKARFLDAPISQGGLFGNTVEDVAQQFSAVQKQTEALKHIFPRRDSATTSACPSPRVPPAAPKTPAPSPAEPRLAARRTSQEHPQQSCEVSLTWATQRWRGDCSLGDDNICVLTPGGGPGAAVRDLTERFNFLTSGVPTPSSLLERRLASSDPDSEVDIASAGTREEERWAKTHPGSSSSESSLLRLPFKMLTTKRMLTCIRHQDWFAAIDLKDAYFHVSILPRHRPFLWFAFEGRAYQYKVLPFGLSLSPRVFTKVTEAALSPLWRMGIRILNYLDNWLLIAHSRDALCEHRDLVLRHLSHLGLQVNREKSKLSPVHKTAVPRKTFQRLLGHMAAAAAVTLLGLLHMRPLHHWLHDRVPRWAWHCGTLQIGVSLQCRRLFSLWSDPAFLQAGVPLGQVSRHLVAYTDASSTGWGAVCNGQAASGSWTGPRLQWHINCLELLAVLLALRCFRLMLRHKHVLVSTDSTATVAYINHQGGLRSRRMSQLARHLLLWSQKWLKSLCAVYIPGELNRAADQLSWQSTHPGEWRLYPQRGSPRQGCAGTQLASGPKYAFPPVSLLAQTLCKIREEEEQVLLVAPYWPTRTWFPDLICLCLIMVQWMEHPLGLREAPFEPLASVELKYLSLKTALLTALASIKRRAWIWPGDSHVILRPRPSYVPKVPTTPFRDQVVNLQALPPEEADPASALLCPVRALRIYVDHTWHFRRTEQLFVCFGGQQKGNAVSKQRLAHWVVDAISLSYQNQGEPCPLGVRAHSTRSVASSYALAHGASLADICRAAGWATPNTFARFDNLHVEAVSSRVLT
ncbi:ORF V: Enzymatic polyprotein [Labeo rohita]|uniref:ribonuclease H n=1 Tax=Labeo rohita TaxID=84645 RepID=A0ABQ8L1E9_LABRO|nr:ORF V: Enzymatic polyprotein [Labeo rohita]